MMKKRQDSPAMLSRVMVKSSTKMDLEEEEDWLEQMIIQVKSGQLTGAGEDESNWVNTYLQKDKGVASQNGPYAGTTA